MKCGWSCETLSKSKLTLDKAWEHERDAMYLRYAIGTVRLHAVAIWSRHRPMRVSAKPFGMRSGPLRVSTMPFWMSSGPLRVSPMPFG